MNTAGTTDEHTIKSDYTLTGTYRFPLASTEMVCATVEAMIAELTTGWALTWTSPDTLTIQADGIGQVNQLMTDPDHGAVLGLLEMFVWSPNTGGSTVITGPVPGSDDVVRVMSHWAGPLGETDRARHEGESLDALHTR